MTKITVKQRFARAAAIGLAGLIVAFAITSFDRAFQNDGAFLRCAAGGAFLAGLLLAGGFGGQGAWGWFRAGLSFGAATVLGAILAVMLLPLDGFFVHGSVVEIFGGLPQASLMGPLYVFGEMGDHLWVAAVWVAALGGIQVASQGRLIFIDRDVSP